MATEFNQEANGFIFSSSLNSRNIPSEPCSQSVPSPPPFPSHLHENLGGQIMNNEHTAIPIPSPAPPPSPPLPFTTSNLYSTSTSNQIPTGKLFPSIPCPPHSSTQLPLSDMDSVPLSLRIQFTLNPSKPQENIIYWPDLLKSILKSKESIKDPDGKDKVSLSLISESQDQNKSFKEMMGMKGLNGTTTPYSMPQDGLTSAPSNSFKEIRKAEESVSSEEERSDDDEVTFIFSYSLLSFSIQISFFRSSQYERYKQVSN